MRGPRPRDSKKKAVEANSFVNVILDEERRVSLAAIQPKPAHQYAEGVHFEEDETLP